MRPRVLCRMEKETKTKREGYNSKSYAKDNFYCMQAFLQILYPIRPLVAYISAASFILFKKSSTSASEFLVNDPSVKKGPLMCLG
mmetsp:Transcript_7896/g.16464  ORF Transcript_7896/g.16464 Transcript_7896/m.16464 type:complete len:85 (+) Transcript_7896:1232-1486(+)